MYSLHLSAEQIEFRDTVRAFVEDEVKPVTLKADRLDLGDRTLPLDVLDKASQMGLRALALSEELGGVGADNLTSCIVTEELAAGDADLAAVLTETATLAGVLFGAMTPAQRERYLPPFLADDRFHLARGCREPGDDSALGINYHRAAASMKLSTTAKRDGEHWIVNGAKEFVANAPVAKLIAVEADTGSGPALFLMTPGTKGLTVTEQGEPRWFHGVSGRLDLKDVRIPAGDVIPSAATDPGHSIPSLSALNLGICRAAYEAALEYAGLRIQGGRAIVEHQAIGAKLAQVAITLEVARNTVWQAAWASDHPKAVADHSLPDLPLTTMTQVFVSEALYRATKDAAECFGAMGVMRDMPLQKYIHDARICLYSGDGNADARLRVAEATINYRRGPTAQAAG